MLFKHVGFAHYFEPGSISRWITYKFTGESLQLTKDIDEWTGLRLVCK
jgi:hypothetical protein